MSETDFAAIADPEGRDPFGNKYGFQRGWIEDRVKEFRQHAKWAREAMDRAAEDAERYTSAAAEWQKALDDWDAANPTP